MKVCVSCGLKIDDKNVMLCPRCKIVGSLQELHNCSFCLKIAVTGINIQNQEMYCCEFCFQHIFNIISKLLNQKQIKKVTKILTQAIKEKKDKIDNIKQNIDKELINDNSKQ